MFRPVVLAWAVPSIHIVVCAVTAQKCVATQQMRCGELVGLRVNSSRYRHYLLFCGMVFPCWILFFFFPIFLLLLLLSPTKLFSCLGLHKYDSITYSWGRRATGWKVIQPQRQLCVWDWVNFFLSSWYGAGFGIFERSSDNTVMF